MSNKPRILVCDPIHEDGLARLRQEAAVDVVEGPGLSEAELSRRMADYAALICRSRTAVPATVLEQADQLKVIGRAGVGLDHIAVGAAEARGVVVVNTPGANSASVAEHTMALILALAHQITRADSALKAGRWAKKELQGIAIEGRTLGIIGFGRIGKRVAVRARAFGMRIVTNQPRPTVQLEAVEEIEHIDLLDLLPVVDFLTLHVPLKPANVGLIGTDELALMKPSAYLINTSRGGIVDEEALLEALDNGKLAGAGLDVFKNEPTVNQALVQHSRVVATPHIAASTADAQRAAALEVAEKVLAALGT